MADITIFNNQKVLGKDFNVYGNIDNPLFLAKDVAEMIEYSTDKVGQMLSNVDDDEKLISPIYYSGQVRDMWLLTEYGLYEVLMQSRKPIAKEFKKEIKAILKELRQSGVVITENAQPEAIDFKSKFGNRRIRKTFRESTDIESTWKQYKELSKIERDAHRIDNRDRIRACDIIVDELSDYIANNTINMKPWQVLLYKEVIEEILNTKQLWTNKMYGGIKSNMTVKINNLEQENQELKEQVEALTPPEREWITIDKHGFSENYMYSWSDTGQVTRSRAYNRWISSTPNEDIMWTVYDTLYTLNLSEDVAIEIGYICKDNFDVKNFDKATIDLIFNRIMGVDDHIVKKVTSYRIDTCDSFDDGKIIFTIYNL